VVGVRRYGKAYIASDDLLVQQGDVLYLAVLQTEVADMDAFIAKGPVE